MQQIRIACAETSRPVQFICSRLGAGEGAVDLRGTECGRRTIHRDWQGTDDITVKAVDVCNHGLVGRDAGSFCSVAARVLAVSSARTAC